MILSFKANYEGKTEEIVFETKNPTKTEKMMK